MGVHLRPDWASNLLRNTPLVLGEVKSRLTAREAEYSLYLVEQIRPTLPAPEVRVVFFGLRIGLDARRVIREAGVYFLFSNGRFLKTL